MGPQFQPQTRLSAAELDALPGQIAALGNAVLGPAAGLKLVYGETALDGANPTDITTGLASIVAAVVTLKRTTSPGVTLSFLSVDYSGASGTLSVYAWRPTSATDTTLVGSGQFTPVSWIALGA